LTCPSVCPWLYGRVSAANRVYDSLDALAAHAVAWLDAHLPEALLTRGGLRSSKFEWLPT
jgi:hypothetical protein